MTDSAPNRGTIPHLTAVAADDGYNLDASLTQWLKDHEPGPAELADRRTLGGWTVPDDDDAKAWHELAVQRAAAEGIEWPTLDEFRGFAALLERNGITPDVIAEHIAAEQAGITEGTVKPIRRSHR